MSILVTSASGSNGDGYGALLSFRLDGTFIGSFSDDPRIVDPRGMSVSPDRQHLYVNSGNDRILALDTKGMVVRDTGSVPGLNAGGGNLGPDGRYYVGLRSVRTIAAFPPYLDGAAQSVLPVSAVPYPRGFAFGTDVIHPVSRVSASYQSAGWGGRRAHRLTSTAHPAATIRQAVAEQRGSRPEPGSLHADSWLPSCRR